MKYNLDKDYYICVASKKSFPNESTTKKSKSNFKSIINIYECELYLDYEYKNK